MLNYLAFNTNTIQFIITRLMTKVSDMEMKRKNWHGLNYVRGLMVHFEIEKPQKNHFLHIFE